MAGDEIIQITPLEDENEKLKLSEEADFGPLTSNKPLDENEISLTVDEIKKLKSLAGAGTGQLTSDKPLIQEVTHILRSCYSRGECKRYFKPTSVAVGPLNHQKMTRRDLRMERGEERKRKLAAMFINFTSGTTEDFYKKVKKKIKSLRNCYNFKGGQKWDDDELALIFLVDGCALLHFIVLDVINERQEFSGTEDIVGIEKVDFFLLENQLPYQLLQILIETFAEFSGEELRPKLKKLFNDLITEFINRIYLNLTAQQQHQIWVDHSQQQEGDPAHLLDLLRRRLMGVKSKGKDEKKGNNKDGLREKVLTFAIHPLHSLRRRLMGVKLKEKGEQQKGVNKDGFREKVLSFATHPLDLLRRKLMGVKSKKKGEKQEEINKDFLQKVLTFDNSKPWHSNRNVRELKDKGIRFKAREKGGAITDIDFNGCCWMPTLKLVPIFLHNTTMPMLLNLVAYELCPDFKGKYEITSHLSFLDSLIDNGEDVKELRDAGVLHSGLGSDEAVAELFNKISNILVSNLTMHSKLQHDIHEYCNSKKSHLSSLRASVEAKLTYTYFRSPWTFLVLLGAVVGLIMTGMQTYYSLHENKLPY